MKLFSAVLLSTIVIYANGVADDMDGFDDKTEVVADDMDGFDDNAKETKDDMDGFGDDTNTTVDDNNISTSTHTSLIEGLSGELTEQVVYSPKSKAPHDGINSVKSSLFLDYDHKFEGGVRVKINAKAYYDAIYAIKDKNDFTHQEIDQLESEVELFDAFVEGKMADNIDYKIGRQVVVWGRSDTIRVTDILNPIDNRVPGMVDIEDLRLPVNMAKFDYFAGDWRVTPIVIFEQRFSKKPPIGSEFNLLPKNVNIVEDDYSDLSYAMSISGEFSGWDISFYGADTRNDDGYFTITDSYIEQKHNRVKMLGSALNILTGSWLFKAELAYFDGLKYSTTGDRKFDRDDILLGLEYNGIADTVISYDLVRRNIHDYDGILLAEKNPLKKYDYQQALRVSSEFLNASLKINYLISLYGKKLDEGGFQRFWGEYELSEDVHVTAGVVDYIGGSVIFDTIHDSDKIFMEVSYNF